VASCFVWRVWILEWTKSTNLHDLFFQPYQNDDHGPAVQGKKMTTMDSDFILL
jgi:hypothetical protein